MMESPSQGTQLPAPTLAQERMEGPVERLMAYLIDKRFGGSLQFRVQGTPNWLITPYNQERMPVWEALERFAMMIGWDLRWRWLPGSRFSGQLTFFEPPRRKTVPDLILAARDVYSIDTFETSIENIRTEVYVLFGPATARQTVVRAISPTPYRYHRTMWIEEAEGGPLQTSAEAIRLAELALEDLYLTRYNATVSMRFYPFLELHDTVLLQGNGEQFTTSVYFSVTGISHSLEGGKATTNLTLSAGGPLAGNKRWLRREHRQGVRYL